ncbi:putative V-type proton ATPase subunit a [Trypanosoma cruzi]|uniref:V-type proton ATPase subunit a n=2 Tax=Trypanosoma cruzi TaxID=5693 RepID=Q4DK78_TRYCC|nr:vacuolar proton translocating ATPase subunit A, putative [Trypanosoma cruzi]EAN92926.1 vacuolar proton translocating ATPase subunit A, putative [Trypanosoma cruzi]PWV16918.1 putative V-type proton ATPase subunit a [Trypanosoma cruzi]RNC42584.1 putative vacuolar proton translocating ATPase subunit A [Trypanosoma cruzi]|eukprot:XP_814777.1 vacuolar proton translocating ATPase subunit A [Trypanosoma cruzi strain CL Brener]
MPREAASGLWRSEDMTMLQLTMQRETAHDSVLKLGQLAAFQFIDLNGDVNAFQRDFVQEVRRCDDMERKMRYLHEEIEKAGVTSVPGQVGERETMFSLEQKVDEREAEVRELNEQYQSLIEERNRSREHLEVLNRDFSASSTHSQGLNLITGVIPKERVPILERLVYRATRGNSVMQTDDIATPFYNVATNQPIYKCVFGIYFPVPRLRESLGKISEANGATLYAYAENEEQLQGMRESLQVQVETVTHTLQQSALRQRQLLMGISASVYEWRRAVAVEKAVYSTMNMLRFSGATVVAKGWAPVRSLDDIRTALQEAEYLSGAQVLTIVEGVTTKETPPTYFRTNKITSSFQGIVDSYGMARYKEVNPGVFTIITFPYLFGVMYGDIGHGLILTIFSAFLIFMEKSWEGKPLNEIFAMIFGGRYLLLFMGFFAVYLGFLYNDMFGFSVEVFTSGYRWPQLPPNGPDGVVRPSLPVGVTPAHSVIFGVDSAWAETENKLEFYNSIKMKCSVIIGVVQMMVGVILSLMNHLYFGDKLQVWFRFVPEIVFLSCTFGYMCLLIVIKWCTPWENRTHDAPSLLETMTNFFLQPGTVNLPLYRGQAVIQVLLLLIAFAMVPVLLFVIPFMEKKHHDEAMKRKALLHEEDEEEKDEFDFSEVMIHQVIHTIEYVLGCVSNTASYLRLWALSLAHSQLSEVFWNFAFLMTVGLDGGSGIFVFVGFCVWMCATLGVLLGMESLSAFLHALRLHWVEFNNKFYSADGYAFTPFDVAEVLSKIN